MNKRYHTDNPLWPEPFIILSGGFSAILGLVVLAGWYLQNETLVKIYPTFMAMQFNTALSFLLCGIGILAAGFHLYYLTALSGGIVIALSSLTMAQYLLGIDLGIDRLFFKEISPQGILYPGRMSPNTSLNFIITGVGLLLLKKTLRPRLWNFAMGMTGAIIVSVGISAILGYMTGITSAYAWGLFRGIGMAVHTSAGFIIVGLSIMVSAWQDGWVEKAGSPRWFPYAVGLFLTAITFNIWYGLENQEYSHIVYVVKKLQVWPTEDLLSDMRSPLPKVVLFLGLISGGLFTMTIYSGQRRRISAKDVESANHSLRLQIESRKRAEERYHTLFEETKDIIFITNADGGIVDINPAGLELLGYSNKEELQDISFDSVYYDLQDREKFKRAVENAGFVKDFEVVIRKRGGEKAIINLTATAVRDHDGKIVAYRKIARDMTEYKRLEQHLIHAQKMESIGLLTGGIAHDFNNIITAIIGYATLLETKLHEDDPLRYNAENIIKITEKAARLVRGLLTFSRKQPVTLRPLNLNELIRESEHLLSKLVRKGIDLKISPRDGDMVIMADSGQLIQVLMNLVTNASDAISETGVITIVTDRVELNDEFVRTYGYGEAGKHACISVSDTGSGMDKDIHEKIFDPFFTTKEVGKGTGLGLSIVYGIIKDHRGYITVDSLPGVGTTFKIYLPMSGMAARQA